MGKMHRRWAALVLALTAFVAMVGLTPGTALAESVSDADQLKTALAAGGEVTLSDNITVNEQLTTDKDVTLDLNGRTLTLSGSEVVDDTESGIGQPAALVSKASLTVRNGTIDVTGAANGVWNTGSLTIENDATIKCSSDVFYNYGVIRNVGGTVSSAGILESTANNGIITFGGTVNVTGGKISAPYGSGNNITCSLTIFNRAYSNQSDGATVTISGGELASYGYAASTNNLYSGGENGSDLTITGGTLTSTITSIYWPSAGTLTIGSEGSQDGPTITSTNGSGIEMCSGTLNVYGGTISGGTEQGDQDSVVMSEEWVSAYRNNSGSASMGDAITIVSRRGNGYVTAPLNVSLEGGIFKSGQNYGVRYLDCNLAEGNAQLEQEAEVAITGGDFSGKIASVNAEFVQEAERAIITGGKFSDDVSEYVPEDYELNDDGTVTELPDVAMIGTVGYKSLNAAAAAAVDGDTIKLAADVALSEQLVIATDNVTLDLNGHTISCADDFAPASGQNDAKNLVTVNSCTGVTVKNGTIVAGLANRNTLNLWNAKDVIIEDMTLDNTKSSAGAPLIVGASEATVAGKLSVVSGGNSWYGINVDARMVGATAIPASLTFAEGAVVDFSGIQKTGVYVENTAKVAKNDVSVSFEPSVTFSSNIDGFVPVVIAKSVEATVSNPENAGFVMNADGTSHFHTYVLDATTVKEPTCTAEGYTGNRVCSVCGDTIKGEAVPMVAHQLEVRGYVEPTTTTVGYTGDTVCKVCGTVVAKGETIPTVAPGEVVMFRLYNQWTGEHFYTSSELERDSIVEVGWSYEGVGWIAPDEGAPVYRLYNPYVEGGDHHYTMSEVERDACVEAGWSYEGVAWYSADEETGVPVLREYNPYATTGTHNYTISENEHDTLVELGWKDEGVAWYAVK